MGYWSVVRNRALKDALAEMRWTGPMKVLQSVFPTVASGVFTWGATHQPAYGAGASLVGLGAVFAVWVIAKFVSVPPEIDREQRARIFPGPYDDTPIYKLDYCATNQEGTERVAVAKITFTKNVSKAQIKIWAYESKASKHLIYSEDAVSQMKDETRSYELARVSIFDRNIPNRWGGTGQTFSENEPKLIIIEMSESDIRQEIRIILEALFLEQQCKLHVFSSDWNPYFWSDSPLHLRHLNI